MRCDYGTREDGSMWLSIGYPAHGPHTQADWEFGEKWASIFAMAVESTPDTQGNAS